MNKKFRFYDKKYKQWRELPDLFGHYQTHAFRTYGEGFELRHFLKTEAQEKILSGDLVIQQWTGFLDKNGREIYEGDIVESDDTIGGRMYGPVIYDFRYGGFRIVFSDIIHWSFYRAKNPEVLGNIFENHELLEQHD